MEDHRSSNHAVPRRARTGLDASLAESMGIDFKDLHRVRHLLGIAVGAFLAWYPASLALDILRSMYKGGECELCVFLIFVPDLVELTRALDGSFLGMDVCGPCMLIPLPFLVVALALFLTGSVLTVEAINARYRRFSANAGHEKMGR